MSFTYVYTNTLCIPMQIKPNKSPLKNRLQTLLFFFFFLIFIVIHQTLLLCEIGHVSSPSRSCLGRLILIFGGQQVWGGLWEDPLPHHNLVCTLPYSKPLRHRWQTQGSLHLVLPSPAPCFYLVAAPNSCLTVKE